MYFDTNTITSKPQNASGSGFNDWGTIEYKPDAFGMAYLASLGITAATQWSYDELTSNIASMPELTADIDVNGIYTNVLFQMLNSSVLSETIRIFAKRLNEKDIENAVLIKWLNTLGGYQFDLFFKKVENSFDYSEKSETRKYITDFTSENTKEFTINSQSRKKITLYRDLIETKRYINNKWVSNVDKWNDFRQSVSKNDLFIFTRKYYNTCSITNTSPLTAAVNVYAQNHKLKSGDEIIISETTDYNGTFKVYTTDENNFSVLIPYVSNQSGSYFLKVKYNDWLRCQLSGSFETIVTTNNTFNIKFDVSLPSIGI